jgi:hypothetical protein
MMNWTLVLKTAMLVASAAVVGITAAVDSGVTSASTVAVTVAVAVAVGSMVALEAVAAIVGRTTTPGSTAIAPQAAKKIISPKPIRYKLNFCFTSIS